MPFPLLIPLAMAGGSALGGWLSGRNAGRAAPMVAPPYNPSPAEQQQFDLGNLLTTDLRGTYQNLLSRIGMPSLEAAQDFWMPILQGDRSAISGLLAPDIDLISRQYDSARRSMEMGIPRGGGRDATLSQSRNLLASEISGLIGRARPAAAQALFNIGGTAVPAGLSAAGLQGQNIQNMLQAMLQGRQLNIQAAYPQLAAQQNAFNTGAATGRGIWDILNRIWPQGGGANISGIGGSTPAGFLQNFGVRS